MTDHQDVRSLVDLGVVGRGCLRPGVMFVIIILTWQRTNDR